MYERKHSSVVYTCNDLIGQVVNKGDNSSTNFHLF